MKTNIFLNDAGTEPNDPILKGLKLGFTVKIGHHIKSIVGFLSKNDIAPINPFNFTLIDNNVYQYCEVAGGLTSLSIVGKNVLRIEVTSTSNQKTILEYVFYIANAPNDLMEIIDVTRDWNIFNENVNLLVPPQMPIRFLNSWSNNRKIKHFGGISYIQVPRVPYDVKVIPFTASIKDVSYIYLRKKLLAMDETHGFTLNVLNFDESIAIPGSFFVTSPACLPRIFTDPEIEEEE